jgi:hypothetical protein
MKRGLIALMILLALVVIPLRSHADVLTSAALGTSIGILAGSIALAFTQHPEDHLNYATIGAAVGFGFGLALGLSDYASPSSPALSAFYEDGGQRGTEHEHIYGIHVNLPFNNTPWQCLGL